MTTLYLFSSNIRPQYEQDILDVAAAARRSLLRFRYEGKYVDSRVRQAWSDDKLQGQSATVVYSIQQPALYHPPAFIPVRAATVVRSRQEGSVFVIDFRVGDYAVLRPPAAPETPGQVVASFSAQVRGGLFGHPGHEDKDHRFSAVEGDVPDGFLTMGDSAEQFERLTRLLAGTVSFASHVFWRISGISELGDTTAAVIEDGRWRLESNRTYELMIVQYQPDVGGRPVNPPPAKFLLSSDTSLLEVIGDKAFEISSRYDAIPVRIRVPALTDERETVLTIRPDEGTKGPRADVHALVGPTKTRRALGSLLAVTAVVLVAMPGLLGKEASFGDKVWFPIVAAAITFGLGWWALPVRKP